jgi:hypothetical protein
MNGVDIAFLCFLGQAFLSSSLVLSLHGPDGSDMVMVRWGKEAYFLLWSAVGRRADCWDWRLFAFYGMTDDCDGNFFLQTGTRRGWD